MTSIINDYNADDNLSPKQKDELQTVLEDFRDNVWVPMRKFWPNDDKDDPFTESHFDSLVQGFVLAKTGSTMLAAWSWCWPAILKD